MRAKCSIIELMLTMMLLVLVLISVELVLMRAEAVEIVVLIPRVFAMIRDDLYQQVAIFE